LAGTPGYAHVVATDEHDEDGVLISDEFTDPHKRQASHEKRMRKMDGVLPLLPAPELHGAADAQVTLLGWGSTEGVIREAMEQLADAGVVAKQPPDQMAGPAAHGEAIVSISVQVPEGRRRGEQLQRAVRALPESRDRVHAAGHIRKYDGEPFMPHHIVDGVKAILEGATKLYVPVHEIQV